MLKFPYDPIIPLLGTYSKEMKIYAHTKICMGMLWWYGGIIHNSPKVQATEVFLD
jgi:hypothetical protein